MPYTTGVSIILPVCNEETMLPQTVPKLLASANEVGAHILWVCNGCTDDSAEILPPDVEVSHFIEIIQKILADFDLGISIEKTESAIFKDSLLASSKPIQYLGFTYDGRQTLIRDSSIGAYTRKMRRGIHAKMVAAKMKKRSHLMKHISVRL